jgi:cysteine desulfuration protein SufE
MSPADQEAALREAFSIIPDPHERLSAIMANCTGAGLPEVEKRDELLVPGCVSSVWLKGRVEDNALRLRWDAVSPLVRGLAGLVCRVYNGTPPVEAAAHDTQILESLGLTRQVSPTRLHGLAKVALRIRELASGNI